MKIYLASGFRRRYTLRKAADELRQRGHEIVSSWIWLDTRPHRTDPEFQKFAKEIAERNLREMELADAIIIDAWGIAPENNGGVHTELGYALGANKLLFLVGPRGNTFHWLPQIKRFRLWELLLRDFPSKRNRL